MDTSDVKWLQQVCDEHGSILLTPDPKPKDGTILQLDETGHIVKTQLEGLVAPESLILNHAKLATILRKPIEQCYGALKQV